MSEQDIATRWNSTFYMLRRLLEQKKAIIHYSTEHDISATLTKHQWGLLEKVVEMLRPFEEITRQIISDEAMLADVVPIVTAVKMTLAKQTNDSGVQTMKSVMLAEIDERFTDMYEQRLYVVASMVDPRYKSKMLNESQKKLATAMLIEEVTNVIANSTQDDTTAAAPPNKKQRIEPEASSVSVHNVLDELLMHGVASSAQSTGATATVNDSQAARQVRLYLEQPNIARNECPLMWWRVNTVAYADVAVDARRYLSAPPTSVPSECLFSSAGHVYTDRHNRLLPERAEMLLFIKHNLAFQHE